MHISLRPRSASSVSAHSETATRHVSCHEMADLYTSIHQALSESYFDHVSNHRVCLDAMAQLKSIHLPRRREQALLDYVTLVREVYSHAHSNIKHLLYDERQKERLTYWEQACDLFKQIYHVANKLWSDHRSPKHLLILLHHASLYSLYKDVADESVIHSIYSHSADVFACDSPHLGEPEKEMVREYHESIELIWTLRMERPREAVTSFNTHTTHHIKSVLSAYQDAPCDSVYDDQPPLHHRIHGLQLQESFHDFYDGEPMEQCEPEASPAPSSPSDRAAEWLDAVVTDVFAGAFAQLKKPSPPSPLPPPLPRTRAPHVRRSHTVNVPVPQNLSDVDMYASPPGDSVEERPCLPPFDPMARFARERSTSRTEAPVIARRDVKRTPLYNRAVSQTAEHGGMRTPPSTPDPAASALLEAVFGCSPPSTTPTLSPANTIDLSPYA